jgi:hypothetical protein
MPDSVPADGWQLLRLIVDARFMKELSVAEQRYQAVLVLPSGDLSLLRFEAAPAPSLA